ncbi:translation factor GUF1, mitochondrial-like protein [Sarcoptes scabiei]|uniref:Translation factor GUF1 homolog, mitochondrial n=1 Tax=Sarcoptes scabiei TaxID=52283 RepID=A0A132A9V6_SARSC|nr:translation factor GUF1, mitochondrial-like protein [Sarcoptes scabiei]
MTGTVAKDQLEEQFLDNLQVERERGITVKAQTCSLFWNYKNEEYLLNLIDTPGHVDFSYEVWRSLSACEGAILLVDANSGVQAQTIAHFNHALLSDLVIIPVLNKIDLKNADIESTLQQLKKLFEFTPEETLKVSAKTGLGVETLLNEIVERIPPPPEIKSDQLKAVVFDLWFEKFKGIILLIRVIEGQIKIGDRIRASSHTDKVHTVKELNVLHPYQKPIGGNPPTLYAGQVGVVVANINDNADVTIGDYLVHDDDADELLKDLKESKTKSLKSNPMVFASIYPCEKANFNDLKKNLQKLLLNDCSVQMSQESHIVLGNGLLHMEVFCQRLDDEFDAPVVITAPSVPYKIKIKGEKNIKQYKSDELIITNASQLPNPLIITNYYEPMVKGTIITPDGFLNSITSLCMDRRGEQINSYYIDNSRLLLEYKFPLNEIIIDFYDHLKSASSGYASFDYEDAGFAETNLVKLEFRLNDKPVEELSMIVHYKRAREQGRSICTKLQEHLTRQQFKIKIQAVIGSKVVARADIRPYRKDVTAKLYGGDATRRMKLLERQKEGKLRLRRIGNIDIDPETFINVLKR